MALKIKESKPEVNTLKGKLQKQVEHEFENERLYLSMALWCSAHGYPETAKFFSGHALEERQHGMDFINLMVKLKLHVSTPYTTDIPRDFTDMGDLIAKAVEKEVETSKMIASLHKLAVEESSLISELTMQYNREQVEEMQLFNSLQNLYKLCDGSMIDFEMEVYQLKSSDKYKLGTL